MEYYHKSYDLKLHVESGFNILHMSCQCERHTHDACTMYVRTLERYSTIKSTGCKSDQSLLGGGFLSRLFFGAEIAVGNKAEASGLLLRL